MFPFWFCTDQRIVTPSDDLWNRRELERQKEASEKEHPSFEREGFSGFLSLPIVIREKIYDYALSLSLQSCETYGGADAVQSGYIRRSRSEWICQITEPPYLFLVNRQINQEVTNWTYRCLTFLAHVDKNFNVLDTCASENGVVSPENRCAMPFGWDMTRIVSLELHVHLDTLLTTGDADYEGLGFDFSRLAQMTALRRLQVVILGWRNKTVWEAARELLSVRGKLVARLSAGAEKKLVLCLADILKNLPVHVDRKVEVVFGHTWEVEARHPSNLDPHGHQEYVLTGKLLDEAFFKVMEELRESL